MRVKGYLMMLRFTVCPSEKEEEIEEADENREGLNENNQSSFQFGLVPNSARYTASLFKAEAEQIHERLEIYNLHTATHNNAVNTADELENRLRKKRMELIESEHVRLLKLQGDNYFVNDPDLPDEDERIQLADDSQMNLPIEGSPSTRRHLNNKPIQNDKPDESNIQNIAAVAGIIYEGRSSVYKALINYESFILSNIQRLISIFYFGFCMNFFILTLICVYSINNGIGNISEYREISRLQNSIQIMNIDVSLAAGVLNPVKPDFAKISKSLSIRSNNVMELRNSLTGNQEYDDMLAEIVLVETQNQGATKFKYAELIEQYLSKIININQKIIAGSILDLNDPEVWYVLQNGSNLILTRLRLFSSLIRANYESRLNLKNTYIILCIILQIILTVGYAVLESIYFKNFKQDLTRYVSIYLKIGSSKLSLFISKCETYLVKFNTHKEDPEEEDIQEQAGMSVGMISRFGNPIKRFKNLPTISALDLISANIVLLFLAFGFTANIFLLYRDQNSLLMLSPLYANAINRNNLFSGEMLGILSYNLNNTRPIYAKDPNQYLDSNVKELMRVNSAFITSYEYYYNILSTDIYNKYVDTGYTDFCLQLNDETLLPRCKEFQTEIGITSLNKLIYTLTHIQMEMSWIALIPDEMSTIVNGYKDTIIYVLESISDSLSMYIELLLEQILSRQILLVVVSEIILLIIFLFGWLRVTTRVKARIMLAKYVASLMPSELIREKEEIAEALMSLTKKKK